MDAYVGHIFESFVYVNYYLSYWIVNFYSGRSAD